MKKVIQICVIICFSVKISAQIDLKKEFESFIINFDMCQYPFYMDWGENKENSVCEKKHGGGISSEHDLMFVSGQGIKPFSWWCDLDRFFCYCASFQLPPTDSVFLLIFVLATDEIICGEGFLLASYSKQTYQLQDTITIFSRGSIKPQYINEQRINQGADISCFLTGDSIHIYRIEEFSFPREQGFKKLKTVKYNTTYFMTQRGKFIKKREEIEEELFDEIGKQLEFPNIPFLGRR